MLARYFPELVESLRKLDARRFVLDGEIVIPIEGRLSFDDLLLRVHPAESRVRKPAAEHPALFVVFDLLADEKGKSLLDLPVRERRRKLEEFAQRQFAGEDIRLSPATTEMRQAEKWFQAVGGNLDGIVAKRLDLAYRSGKRDGMQKVKHKRTADCVVGGFRYAEGKKVTDRVEPLRGGSGFTGRAPGGPSRWSNRRSDEWQPLAPELVVEVEYDHFTGGRFRHGTKLVRWRPDKAPSQCTFEQIDRRGGTVLKLLQSAGKRNGGTTRNRCKQPKRIGQRSS